MVKKDTLRAFRAHKEVNIFDNPGSADVTADVNFGDLQLAFASGSSLHKDVGSEVKTFGPVTQRTFLFGMGLSARLDMLCKNTTFQKANAMKEQVHMLTDEDKMGTRFKVMAVVGSPKNAERPRVTLFEG